MPNAAQALALAVRWDVRDLLVLRPQQEQSLRTGRQFEVGPVGVLWWPDPKSGRIFNALGKLVQQRDDFGRLRSWSYDAAGNPAEYVDFDGGKWLYDSGSWHFRCGVTNPLGAVIRFSHTTNGDVASFIDAGGARSEYLYDLKGHLVQVNRHGVVRETYTRDAVGNLLAKHASNGRELLRFEIGPGNLPISRTLASGDKHSFQYDQSGRDLVAGTKKDRIEFAYDAFGNRVMEKRNGLGVSHHFQGWQKPTESIVFDRFAVYYEWTSDDTLVVIDPGGESHQIRFFPHGLVERRLSNESWEMTQYDNMGRCLFKCAQRRSGQVWRRRYHWSGEGELQRIEDNTFGEIRHQYRCCPSFGSPLHRRATREL